MTQARAWSEGSAIINECESDKTMPTKQFSQHQTVRNHSLFATRKDFQPINENELMRAIRNSHKIERETAGYQDEDKENKASNLAKIGAPRTEYAFNVNRNEIRFECQRR